MLLSGRWSGDGPHLLGQIDADRTPGDAATTADTAGTAILIVPSRKLMRQPLAIACRGAMAHAATMQIGEFGRIARISSSRARDALTAKITDVCDRSAHASRAHHGAVATGKAAFADFGPARVLQITKQQVMKIGARDLSAHAGASVGEDGLLRRDLRGIGRCARHGGEDSTAGGGAAVHQKHRRTLVRQLGERQIEAGGDLRSGVHRVAEAGTAGNRTIYGNDEYLRTACTIIRITGSGAEQCPIHQRDGVQFARACSDESHALARWRLRLDLHGITAHPGAPQALLRWVQKRFPRLCTHSVAEERIVTATLQSVVTAVLHVRPAARQVGTGLDVIVNDDIVAHDRAEQAVPATLQLREQGVKAGMSQHLRRCECASH